MKNSTKVYVNLLWNSRFFRYCVNFLKKHTLPGFEGLSVWDIMHIFFKGISQSSISDRASIMTFRLTMAIFPALLFFCALIPFIPFPNPENSLLKLFGNMMPGQLSILLEEALKSLLKKQNGSLLSISLLVALYFGANTILSLMDAMNQSALISETRSRWRQRLTALGLLLLIFIMTVTALAVIYGTTEILRYLKRVHIISFKIKGIIYFIQLLILYIQLFFTISLIYRAAPAKRLSKRLFSPGTVVATNASFLVSLGLTYFFNNFSNFNKIYGTIGSVPVILTWIFVNCMVLLVGFELNASIYVANKNLNQLGQNHNSSKVEQ